MAHFFVHGQSCAALAAEKCLLDGDSRETRFADHISAGRTFAAAQAILREEEVYERT